MSSTTKTILICGSRGWTESKEVVKILDEILFKHNPSVIIHGGASSGVDRIVEYYCDEHGIHSAPVLALWSKWGKAAGPIRNAAMLTLKPDLVVALWDGESKGTASMIKLAEQAGVPVEIVYRK